MKSLINSALLKEQLKRFWSLGVLTLLGYILLIILPIFLMNYNTYHSLEELTTLFSMQHPVMIGASILVPLVTVLVTFSYLFQPKATTAIHAFPISKNQLLLTNVFTGFILIVIPLLILCGFLLMPIEWIRSEISNGASYALTISPPIELFPNGIQEGTILNSLPIVAGFFFRTLLVFVFYYAIFLVAAIVSGNAIIYILVSVVFPFIPSALLFLTQMIGFYFCFGFEPNNISNLLSQLAIYTNPILLGLLFHLTPQARVPSNLIPYILVHMLIIIALFALCFYLNHKRKQERAGDSVVFTPLKNALTFSISLVGMILLGLFFLDTIDSITFMYVGFVIGFIVAYFIAQMIAEKSFNVFVSKARDLIRFGGVAIGLFLLIILVTKFDLTGYSRYTPNPDDVTGVYLNYPNDYFGGLDNKSFKDNFFIEDKQIIADAIAIQKQIIGNKATLRRVFLQNLSGRLDTEKYGSVSRQYFLYKLKNEKIVLRRYIVPLALSKESGLSTLLLTNQVILSPYHSFKSPENIRKIVIDSQKADNSQASPIFIEKPEQIRSIITEMEKDILKSEQYRLSQINQGEPVTKEGYALYGHVELKSDIPTSGYNSFNLDSCENTKNWLLQNGF